MITNITILSNGSIAPNQMIPLGHKFDNGLDSIQFDIPKEFIGNQEHNYHYYLAFSMKKLQTILLPINWNANQELEFHITTTITKNPGIYDMLFLITEEPVVNGDIDNTRKVFTSVVMKGQVLDNFLTDPISDESLDENLQFIYESLYNLRDQVLRELQNGDYIGDVFAPSVDEDGVISWTLTDAQDAEKLDITPRNITGPVGPYYIPRVEDGVLKWTGSSNRIEPIDDTNITDMVKDHSDAYLSENLEPTVTPIIKNEVNAAVDAKFKFTWDPVNQILYITTEDYEEKVEDTEGE